MFAVMAICEHPFNLLTQVLKTALLDTNISSRHLRHLLVRASSLTVCCSPCYTSIIHCFDSLTSQILFWALQHCFLDFIVTWFRP